MQVRTVTCAGFIPLCTASHVGVAQLGSWGQTEKIALGEKPSCDFSCAVDASAQPLLSNRD